MKSIVIYYSNKGSNGFLAKKVAEKLSCEIEKIRPRLDVQLFLMMGISFGIKPIKANLTEYDRVILCGPIWVGKFITPLKVFVKKYKNEINNLIFATCCGSSYEKKNEKFGHGLVFNEVKDLLKEKCVHCEAFPITLILTEQEEEDPNSVMNTRLSEDNFKGEILDRFNRFIDKITK